MACRLALSVVAVLSAFAALPAAAGAGHAWWINGRAVHWASTANPAHMESGDNLDDPVWDTQQWAGALLWSASPNAFGRIDASPFMRVYVRPGGLASNEIELHDGFYGRVGWIGQATISIDASGHIRDATIQLNQSYALSTSQKQATINHELGHALGLGHQPGTVMCAVLCGITDPVQHDYDVINYVNAHTDGYNTAALQLQAPAQAGQTTVRRDGARGVVYVTRLDDQAVNVVFRDYVSEQAANAALSR
jgi:hypothetical protein